MENSAATLHCVSTCLTEGEQNRKKWKKKVKSFCSDRIEKEEWYFDYHSGTYSGTVWHRITRIPMHKMKFDCIFCAVLSIHVTSNTRRKMETMPMQIYRNEKIHLNKNWRSENSFSFHVVLWSVQPNDKTKEPTEMRLLPAFLKWNAEQMPICHPWK